MLDGRLFENGDAPVLSPPPCLWGPHSLIAGVLWAFLPPLVCSAGLAVPPLDAVGDFVQTRARVSPGLGLAPALLLGLGLPFPLSLWLLPSSSLALTHAPQAQAQAGIPPTPGVVVVTTLFLRLVLRYGGLPRRSPG
jgi:hypothetical protein